MIDKIKKMYLDENLTMTEICNTINISYYKLSKILKELKIKKKYNFNKKEMNIGSKYGFLTVVKEYDKKMKRGVAKRWICLCDCGKEIDVNGSYLRSNAIKSCGCHLPKGKAWKGYGDIGKDYWTTTIKGADARSIEFNITIEYAWELFLKQNKKCALTGLDLKFSDPTREKRSNKTASLDRIDHDKGYTEDNVQWVHKDINRMKNSFDNDYYIKMCELVAKNSKDKNVVDISI